MNTKGFTLVELIVAVGLFALVMTLVAGAYIVMIGLTERAQNAAIGIDNLSFALETMTRSIRTGTSYNCGVLGGNCPNGADSFLFTDANGVSVTFKLSGSTIQETKGSTQSVLTDPSVNISSLMFYVSGTASSDVYQPHVTITVSGTVFAGSGKPPQSFAVETGATMRGPDIGGGSGGGGGGGGSFSSECTGGTIIHSGGYTIHKFTSSGTFACTSSGNVEYLVVGGGGGGGGHTYQSGGGGGGGIVYNASSPVTAQAYTVTVGNGGIGGGPSLRGVNGDNSVFGSITAYGGGGGGNYSIGGGLNGGCGGGGPSQQYFTGGTGSQGGDGGVGANGTPWNGGGGGGAAPATGGTGAAGGNGGAGYTSTISGSSVKYAGGGGGSSYYGTPGTGTDGGGNGSVSGNAGSGTANTGGGGGGVGQTTGTGGTGGSGIVIVRYLTP